MQYLPITYDYLVPPAAVIVLEIVNSSSVGQPV